MKIIATLLLLSSTIFANHLTYKVKAPLFGTIGEVNVDYSVGSSYNINASMRTFGFAKKITGNRHEHYTSKGFVSGNIYKSKKFTQNATYKNKKEHLEYSFNYGAKKITKKRRKWKNGKEYVNDSKTLNYWTYNDFFSVYHNIVIQLKGKNAGTYGTQISGLEKYNGKLTIIIPTKAKQQKEAESMGVKGVWIFHIITHKKIMGSKNGEIVFAVGNDGIAKAVRVLGTPFVSHMDAVLAN